MDTTPRQPRDAATPRRRGRRIATTAATVSVLLLAASGAAYGVLGLSDATDTALRDRTAAQPRATEQVPSPSTSEPSGPAATPSATPDPSRAPQPSVAPEPEPIPVLAPGAGGLQVRELQSRLAQLAWFGPTTTGDYGPDTRTAVAGFQEKRGLESTGVVDRATWRRLLAMTSRPTEAQLFNRPGPALFAPGASGPQVREIQARLRQIAWFSGDVTDAYGPQTRDAVAGFQGKRGIPQTGSVDQRTLDLLEGMTSEPTADDLANREPKPSAGAPLDPRCLSGPVLCIDKTSRSLRWVVDGEVRENVEVRFGSAELPTREGQFSVYRKSRDHVSSLFNTSMPFAMFFSGGQAVHYSPDFAAHGYDGASHGCVNVRDYDAVAALFDAVPLGTKVIIYWS
ncbi:L,D-transpeptidase family protein [Nocardioides mesophilus]|uniref:Peptidoglycan-binding protein n=1 Tax=Nocardioides mesophilus TaxID=433659 RepID=A0A7G9R6T0_9ACTN|nr:peptidoglycan-binding protein [Nocardioides mesophilus]QNN51305.1 peptidoglycan-binding protein [Nocardioides mesophilus]